MPDLDFYALASGSVPKPFEDDFLYPAKTIGLAVTDLGMLRVPSGRLEACDPYDTLGDGPSIAIDPGDYPVRVTVADVSKAQDGSRLHEAYLSVILAGGEAASVEPARPVEGGEAIVAVEAGTVAFVDHEAIATAMPPNKLQWDDEIFQSSEPDSWFSLMEDPGHYREGSANIVMPLASNGENVVISNSGWGDGVYPVVLTRDADGVPLGLHIDLMVVGSQAASQ
ncbi:DUF4241 domain-containing protein [Propionibacterium australiense]|uniref:DUF4241 domain-containing protein n=1 Tax=Propionibacterium australiense TaxID=119981 RepID=A0A383S999_9ACTN|nr:DUF4241 domain-containing protein [Propionibacterium australiense]RLP06227.1 DUF4241 domain-containing protein [Propionibacterium australiense]RLP07565.1 DUF4241 domain-containing protein [Propionibacterium australiense]SYZ34580.1 Protein of unknown function (DUF4241) [Propionibacterium australiense]VEH92674.1 Uncharacterised protein [Propionibacterium australiense]